jgi:selenide,water dikinase
MRRFQVLGDDAAPAAGFPSRASMGMEDMPCGGCAAKVGASPLRRALERLPAAPADAAVRVGLEHPDDAAAFDAPGGAGPPVLATVDAFRAFTDDPWLVGRVAAVNAASDVYAVGGRPRHALALVTVAEEDPARAEEALYQTLSGVRAGLDPLGISLVGGHSTSGEGLFVGLTITGELEGGDEILGLAGLRCGDRLILTKALGTGVVLAADMRGEARGDWVIAAHASMLRANRDAAHVARACGARACTDVSGFGLAGHLAELLRASGVSAELWLDALPALEGARTLLARGVRSTYHEQNTDGRRGLAVAPELVGKSALELLFDPQTSGGLLFGVPSERCDEAVAALRRSGDARAAVVGEVVASRGNGALFAVSPTAHGGNG